MARRITTINEIQLVANSSITDTFPGNKLDVALLKINYQPRSYFELNTDAPGQFDPIFMLGHPIRSERNPEHLKNLGYKNADSSLRVSYGSYLYANNATIFLSDLDGGPGNSGSPTIDSNGKIIGILSTGVGNAEAAPLAYGGFNPQHVSAAAICSRLEIPTRYSSIQGCKLQAQDKIKLTLQSPTPE